MRKFKFHKLVRDKIVEGIIASGNKPQYRTLSEDEFLIELKKKVIEEAVEIPRAGGEDLVKELADLQEVIDSVLNALQVSKDELSAIQKQKNEKAGSFKNKQYIEFVETTDSEWIKYYTANPDKYPEIS